jgi:hypothetical protein
MRSAFFTTYAAVMVAAVLKVPDENWEILSIPVYFMQVTSLHVVYERCVQPTGSWGKRKR